MNNGAYFMRRKNITKGQSLVEFALTLPLLLLIIFGVFDLGRLFYVKITVINAAREGARYLAFNPDDKDSTPPFSTTITAAMSEVQASVVVLESADVAASCDDGACNSGTTAQVTVTGNIELGLFGLFADTYPLTGTARMYVP